MAGKRGAAAGEGSKKAQGQARKADAAAQKKATAEAKTQAVEDQKWEKGAKDSSKKEAAAAKAIEAAKKKAERDALEAEEMASLKSAKTNNAKSAAKKPSRGLDAALAQSLGDPLDTKKGADLNASGIDNALDALSLTGSSNAALDRHPERRFKAAYNAFEERRLEEMKDDKTLRKQQKVERIRKEFEKHPDNPFNQLNASYNMNKDDISQMKQLEKDQIEKRLASP